MAALEKQLDIVSMRLGWISKRLLVLRTPTWKNSVRDRFISGPYDLASFQFDIPCAKAEL
jgi:hypothetical protein